MAANSVVLCPGAVFSSLLSEHLCNSEAQEGFLLGSNTQYTSTQISDADINKQTTENTTHISSYHSLALLGSLYDCSGTVRQSTLDAAVQMAAANKQSVVGWFTWRRCSEPWDVVLLRERLVHLQLMEALGQPDLLFLICNWRTDGPDAFPTTNCLLHHFHNNAFVRLPLRISNLGNTSNTDYKLDPTNSAIYSSPALGPIASKLHTAEPGVADVTELHACLEDSLKQQLQQLSTLQQHHRTKLNHLIALRSLCYHNGIVPDFEFPCEIDQEKNVDQNPAEELKEDQDTQENKQPDNVNSNCNSTENTPEKETEPVSQQVPASKKETLKRKASAKTETRGLTPERKDEVRRGRSPGQGGTAADLGTGLDKLSVCSPPRPTNARVSPARDTNGGVATSPAAKGKSSNGAASPGLRPQSATRSTRSPSVTKVKRRVNSSSPRPDGTKLHTPPDKPKQAWK